MKGGLTVVPLDQQPPLDAMVPLLKIQSADAEAVNQEVVADGVGKGAKGSRKGKREGLRSRATAATTGDEGEKQ